MQTIRTIVNRRQPASELQLLQLITTGGTKVQLQIENHGRDIFMDLSLGECDKLISELSETVQALRAANPQPLKHHSGALNTDKKDREFIPKTRQERFKEKQDAISNIDLIDKCSNRLRELCKNHGGLKMSVPPSVNDDDMLFSLLINRYDALIIKQARKIKINKEFQDEESRRAFIEATKPLIKYLNENHHPHVSVEISSANAKIKYGSMSVGIDEF